MSKPGSPSLGAREFAMLLLVAFLWGSNNVAAHLVTQETNPLFAAGVRFVLTTLMLLPWLRLPRAHMGIMAVIALIAGPLHFGLLYTGFSKSNNVGALTVVMQMWVPISTVLAIFLLHEKPTRQQVLGLGLALLGIVVMCFDPHLLDAAGAALFCLSATSCWGLTMVLVRRAGVLSGLSIQAWMALFTAPALLAASWLVDPSAAKNMGGLSTHFWLLTLYAAIGAGIIGNVIVFNIVSKFEVAQTTPVLLTAPIFALVCGMIFLGERLGAQEVLGAAMVLASIIMIVRGRAAAAP
jgi:O-acetylserine/cysteine efflux transporter